MNYRSLASYLLGLVCLVPILYLNWTATGGYLDRVEIFYTPLIVGSIWLFVYSIIVLKDGAFIRTLVLSTVIIAVILIIPDISYVFLTDYEPYVQELQKEFSTLAMTILILNADFYVSVLRNGSSEKCK